MKNILPIVLCLVVVVVGWSARSSETETKTKWKRVLDFNVLSKDRDHKADLGNHRIVIASWESDLGWELGVFDYPVGFRSENLLYDGNNWHGVQPWMVFAWTKHRSTYPDERVVSYDKGKSQLKIVLFNCETREGGTNSYEFVTGRIEVFHRQD